MLDKPSIGPLEAVYQSPADLELGIIKGELPVPLTVLAEKWLTLGPWRLGFHIIGESHYVRVECAGHLVLHEVLACLRLPQAACQHHHRFSDLRAHGYQQPDYSLAVSFDAPLEAPAPLSEPFLALQFPAIYGQIPLTQIHLDIQEQFVCWWTLHLYPLADRLTAVRTCSQLNLSPIVF